MVNQPYHSQNVSNIYDTSCETSLLSLTIGNGYVLRIQVKNYVKKLEINLQSFTSVLLQKKWQHFLKKKIK